MQSRPVFWTIVAVIVAANLGYTAVAASAPAHLAEPNYYDLQIPDQVTANSDADAVAARLVAAGYAVDRGPGNNFDQILIATLGGDTQTVIRIWHLGGNAGASASASVRCWVSYLRQNCPGDDEAGLRARLQAAFDTAQMPVNAAGGDWGDNDFATFGEFFLFMGQLFIGFVSAVALSIAAVFTFRAPRQPAVPIAAYWQPWGTPPPQGPP